MHDDTSNITLAIAPGCPHCPNVMQALSEMVKQGDIGSMHVINIAVETDFAEQHRIRSVPWLKIGPFILTGAHTRHEIKQWYDKVNSPTGVADYMVTMLTEGQLVTVTQMLQAQPAAIHSLIPLITDTALNINVRLGIGAIMEDFAGQPLLHPLLPELVRLLEHPQARVRGDAAHFLGFLHDPSAISALTQLQNDSDTEVREIAQESIEQLASLSIH
ncbi:MAG: HEAT repeat domain-containing protein [Gammaproteobacteria bacterium]|nr:HEAT repeat domain-containing protein [Gammaproteobacteria bacterium]MDH5651598.1 HEAT repeat domain-containing protein [Gammaproteobacteria bacterium]